MSDVMIGLEVHVELDTKSKMFCGCATKGSNEPNTRTCEVCLGHPGAKPVLNKKAVEYALKLGLALNCNISKEIILSRKSYFYPDMPKNYQISQFEVPLASRGFIILDSGKSIGVKDVHIEEDPSALAHRGSYVLIDDNRSGTPLAEVVTDPDMVSAEEARDFMKNLIKTLTYLGIFDQKRGEIKADANVSIKESGFVRVEVKNITGFKEIERAMNYEILRQKKEIAEGGTIVRDTRSWDENVGITKRLRFKETQEDYGYIIDPDFVRIDVTDEWLEELKSDIPELAKDKTERIVKEYKIKKDDASVLSSDPELADLFEKVVKEVNPKLAASWIRNELVRVLRYNQKSLKDSGINEKHLIHLLKLVESGEITQPSAKRIMEELAVKPFNVEEAIKKKAVSEAIDIKELEKTVKEAIENNKKIVEEIKSGKEKAINFLVGMVMKKISGSVNPGDVKTLIKKLI